MNEPIYLPLPQDCRILVAGDNHGNPELLQNVLNDTDYTENEDFLVLLGDAIEKGPDCLGSLKQAYDLTAGKPRAYFVSGNVDRWCRRLLFGDAEDALSYCEFRPDNTLTQAAVRYGFGFPTVDNYAAICARFREEFGTVCDWYFACPPAVYSDGLIFVHSGIGPGESGYLDDPKMLLSNYDFHRNRRNRSGKWVICGHMPCYTVGGTGASHNPIVDEENRIVFTDGGTISRIHGQQNLTEILKTGEQYAFSHRFSDRFPKVEAVADCRIKRYDPVRVVHDDREYELLTPGRYFSKVRLVRSGQTGYAKNELLVREECFCELDAFVSVAVGERVSLIRGDLDGFAYIKNAAGQLGFVPRHCVGL